MVPPGEADFLVVLDADQVEVNRGAAAARRRADRARACIDAASCRSKKSLNVALLGALSAHLEICPKKPGSTAIRANLPEKLHDMQPAGVRRRTRRQRRTHHDRAWDGQSATRSTRPARRITCPRRSCASCSSRRLQAIVRRAYEHVALFRQRHGRARAHARSDIRALDDIARLPFTVKTDLRDTYPFGLFASPMQRDRAAARLQRHHRQADRRGLHAGGPRRLDRASWCARFAACGLRRGDIIQNAYGYGLFTGGLGAHYGAEALGATVIPISGGNTDRQIMVMKDFGVTAICCTPSYFLHLIERAGEMGVDMQRTAAAGRRLRRRAVDRGDAPAHRGRQRHQGVRHLRPVGDHRARAWPSSARARTACTSSRTISTRRSSTRRPASRCPTARRANWC